MDELRIIKLDKETVQIFSNYILPTARIEFEKAGDIMVLGAATDKYAVGAIATRYSSGNMEILSLFVDEAVRRQKVGEKLLHGASNIYKAQFGYVNNCETSYMIESEDNNSIKHFLKAEGFEEPRPSGQRLFSVNTKDLHNLPVIGDGFSKNYKEDEHIKSFSEITKAQLKEIENDRSVLNELKPSGIEIGIWEEASVIWIENGHVLGWLLGQRSFDGGLVMCSACKRDGAPKGCFTLMLLAFSKKTYALIGEDFNVYIGTINDHSSGLVEKIAAGVHKEYQNYYATTGGKTSWM